MTEAIDDNPPPWPSTRLRDHYVKPHVWDLWVRGIRTGTDNPKMVGNPDRQLKTLHKFKPVVVKNSTGDEVQIDTSRKHTRFDFRNKNFTLECQKCPFFISKISSGEVLKALVEDKIIPFIPSRLIGLCTVGISGSNHLTKLLIEDRGAILHCNIDKKEKFEREAKKRNMGNFFLA